MEESKQAFDEVCKPTFVVVRAISSELEWVAVISWWRCKTILIFKVAARLKIIGILALTGTPTDIRHRHRGGMSKKIHRHRPSCKFLPP